MTMDESYNISDLVGQFRARVLANQHLIEMLSKSSNDPRVKRIVALLKQITPYEEMIPPPAEEILKICEDDPARYRGLHLRLEVLKEQLLDAAGSLTELSKRILLYLEHIQVKPAPFTTLPMSFRDLVKSAVTEQKEMATQICQKAYTAIEMGRTKPPGPAPMPYEDQNQPREFRKLVNGEPAPIGQDYDPRWDPDVRMPGTLHGKFLRFPGPYFARYHASKGFFDVFELSGCLGQLIENVERHYETTHDNFASTGRLLPLGTEGENDDDDGGLGPNEKENDDGGDNSAESEDEDIKMERVRMYEAQQFVSHYILVHVLSRLLEHAVLIYS